MAIIILAAAAVVQVAIMTCRQRQNNTEDTLQKKSHTFGFCGSNSLTLDGYASGGTEGGRGGGLEGSIKGISWGSDADDGLFVKAAALGCTFLACECAASASTTMGAS